MSALASQTLNDGAATPRPPAARALHDPRTPLSDLQFCIIAFALVLLVAPAVAIASWLIYIPFLD